MKETDAKFQAGHAQVLYVEKEQGEFGPVHTRSFMAENYADALRERRQALRAEALRQVQSGATSPIAYWRTVLGMSQADLAARADVYQWSLRRHETPKGFRGIKPAQLARYAEVFGLRPEAVFELPLPEGGTWRAPGSST